MTEISTKIPYKITFLRTAASSRPAKRSDMLPDVRGPLPIRVELKALDVDDFVRILSETENSLPLQYRALMQTEEVTLDFSDEA
ncbi:MAG: HslU--HslV peptidase ATPase subunit, partial [Rhodospirillaceae bacterium]|nr:HslU--HslV peptidase ATPase subunit [Rhodospirillaceae bacterium]